ncbi:MAG: ABC transporter permease [Kouleothrix sp.]|nr:ABC transporter permease [Kouleothrix sp.]
MRLNRIWPIAKKELFQMLRDRRTLIFIFMTPLLQLLVIGYATSGQITNIALAVVDQSHTSASRDLVQAYFASGQFVPGPAAGSLGEAKHLIDLGDAGAAIIIPPDFGRSLGKGQPAEIGFLVDGSEPNTANTVLAASQLIGQAHAISIQTQTTSRRAAAFDVRTRVLYNPQLSGTNYQIPALIGLILQLTTLNLTSEAIVRERETGTMEQLIVTPIKPIELIIGKLIPYAAASLCAALLVFIAGLALFQVPFNGNLLLMFAFMLLFLLVPLGIGLWISAISNTYRQAQALNLLFLLPGFLLSGNFFPIESMPRLLQYITYLVPLRYFLPVLRGIFLKGIGWNELYPQAIALALWAVFFMYLASSRFKKTLG